MVVGIGVDDGIGVLVGAGVVVGIGVGQITFTDLGVITAGCPTFLTAIHHGPGPPAVP